MLRLFLAASAVTTVLPANPAAASAFSVDRTQIVLTPRAPSMLLTLKNESDETLRFKLTVFSWTQTAQGAMALGHTDDIVFFPPLLSLGPKEERKVRVGAAAEFSIRERTYRLFVEELPSPTPRDDGAIRMLTKLGIPIFMEPASPHGEGSLRELGLRDGLMTFTLHNTGNVHFLPQAVTIRGFNRAGALVFEHNVDSWYVLAGGKRDFEVRLPTLACRTVTAVSVIVPVGDKVLQDGLEAASTACAP